MDKKRLASLIKEISNGDMTALEQIYHELRKPVFSLALTLLHDKTRAEDITQETFLSVLQHAHQFKGGNPISWIMMIARNLCLDLFKKTSREVLIDFIEQDNQFSNDSFDSQIIDSIEIQRAMQCLDLTEKQIVVLHLTAGLKHREIAALLGKPLGTVLWKYRVSLKKLENSLKGSDGDE